MFHTVAGNFSTTLGLMKAFGAKKETPAKSSLSERRQTVSYTFFKSIFEEQVKEFQHKLPTWRGLHVMAVDGDNYILPAIGDALSLSYRGSAVKDNREGYYPRMYASTLYDVLSGTVLAFEESCENDELSRAADLLHHLPSKNSLVLYDRFYFSRRLVTEHLVDGSLFLCRLKTGETVLTEIKDFVASGRRNLTVDIQGAEVHLVRVQNPQAGEDCYFATNMQRSNFKNIELLELYARRWDIETSFRDLTCTMNIESWHSHFINGIKQEIFVTLWVFNQVKLWEFSQNPRSWHRILKKEYLRPCLKALLLWFRDHFSELCSSLSEQAWLEFQFIIERTLEKRTRHKRSYPRASKRPARKHSSLALVERRP